MSSKFNIELAQGTITVEGDQEFIMSVYQALQSTLLSGDSHSAAPAPAESAPERKLHAEEPAATEAAVAAGEADEANVTSINVAEAEPAPAEEAAGEAIEEAAPVYEPIPSVLDPHRAEREEAEAARESIEEAPEEIEEEASIAPEQNVVLEQIKESLGNDEDSGSQTSILQRIRDSLSEDADKAEETPRAADAG